MLSAAALKEKSVRVVNRNLCRVFHRRVLPLPAGRFVSICFDDFPKSSVTCAAGMLEARGWRGTWYVAGAFEGATEPNLGQMYDRSDLQRLIENGHDIGTHTFNHLDTSTLSRDEIASQWAQNSEYLKSRGVNAVSSFAYPFGEINLRTKQHHAKYGSALRGTKPGLNRGKTDFNLLKACGIQENLGGIKRALQELDKLTREDGWLIVFTHDVRAHHSPWGTTPQQFEKLLEAITASGAEVLTVADMVRRVEFAA